MTTLAKPCVLAIAFAAGLLPARDSGAEPAEPDAHEDAAWDVMNELTWHGLHDQQDEAWNFYGQTTTIVNYKLGFPAQYTNLDGSPNSLLPTPEWGYTNSVTLYVGFHVWQGGEIYIAPETIGQVPLSDLHGLAGAIQNAELQKAGGATPEPYLSRMYLHQTIDLGGDSVAATSQPFQLGTSMKKRRLVLWLGEFSVLDVMDKNSFAGDLRRELMNMAFLTYAAYDFAADTHGYTYGGAGEVYWDDWALRFARVAEPILPNQLPLDFANLTQYHGDQLELEHDHVIGHRHGAVRVLGYRNRVVTGNFDDAIAAYEADPMDNAANCPTGSFNYGSKNATAPDLCWVRRPQTKVGIGINAEQEITPDVGAFFRAMWSDGKTETYAFNPPDRSIALGALVKGTAWKRRRDLAGVGVAESFLSASHAKFLALGGVDNFIGDGALSYSPEWVAEAFYSYSLFSWMWLSGDFQEVWNPGCNEDRGPVTILGGRVHAEW